MTTQSLTVQPAAPIVAESAWLDRALYPFAPHHREVEGGRMHYVDEGTGRPILFVHGTPSWSFEWRHAIRALCPEYRCVAPDHLGFGLSDKPVDGAYRPADHARRLLDLVRDLDLRDVVLVVHDFGGPIGLPVALEEPGRVSAIVVVNTWMWPHGERADVRRVSRLVASPLGRFLYKWLNASPRWLVPATFADRAKLTAEIHRHYTAPFARRAERMAPWVLGCELAGSDPFYRSLWDARERLRDVPTHVLWGSRDPAFGEDYLERWREMLPDAVVRTVPAGHFPQEEASEELIEVLRGAAG